MIRSSLGYLTPRLSATAESLTRDYVEDHDFLKLIFPEGEIDFVASGPLTKEPAVSEQLFGRHILLNYTRTFDECVDIVRATLSR